MRLLALTMIASVLALSSAFAYVDGYSAAYVSRSPYTTPMYYGNAGSYYGAFDGQSGLTAWGPSGYAPNARYFEDTGFRGHYNPYQNNFNYGYSNRAKPQYWTGYAQNPVIPYNTNRYYMYQGVHRE